MLMSPSETEIERMRKLRREGYSLNQVAKMVGFSASTVYNYTKDIKIQVGRYERNLHISIFDGAIIDIETDGLEPEYHQIITFGWLVKNQIHVVQRAEASATEFYQIMKKELTDLPRPLYAYNAEFEGKFLRAKTGLDLKITDPFEP